MGTYSLEIDPPQMLFIQQIAYARFSHVYLCDSILQIMVFVMNIAKFMKWIKGEVLIM